MRRRTRDAAGAAARAESSSGEDSEKSAESAPRVAAAARRRRHSDEDARLAAARAEDEWRETVRGVARIVALLVTFFTMHYFMWGDFFRIWFGDGVGRTGPRAGLSRREVMDMVCPPGMDCDVDLDLNKLDDFRHG